MIQDKIYSYFNNNPQLRILFIFDPGGDFCYELENEDWPDNYIYHEFDGKSWFNLKYNVENEWQHKKMILLFRMIEPTNSTTLSQFYLADLLTANSVFREENYAAFIEQHNLPRTQEIQVYVSNHMKDFEFKKFNDVLSPYFNAQDFSIDIMNRGFISVYLGQKQILNWDRIIARVVCLGKKGEEKKRDTFFRQLQGNIDATESLQNYLEKITGQRCEMNTTEKVRKIAEAIKYNCIMSFISEDQHDNYRFYKLKTQIEQGRFNQFIENIRNDAQLGEPFFETVMQLASGIKEEEIIKIYGADQPYSMVTAALVWPIIQQIITDLLPGDAIRATERLQDLRAKLPEDSSALTAIDAVLNMSQYLVSANQTGTLRLNTPDEYIKRYTDSFYLMDFYYRKYLEAYYAIKVEDSPIYAKIEGLKKEVDLHYTRKQHELNEEWINCLHDFGGKYSVLTYPRQENFYETVIQPADNKQVVIVSDALRYEVAAELIKEMEKNKHNIDFSCQIAMMPTETAYCKTALLPHHELKLDGAKLLIDDKVLTSNDQRGQQLSQFKADSDCKDYKFVSESSQKDMRELFKKPVVYVMHDKIDKEGHDQSAIEMTKACRETVKDLAALVHSIHMSYNVADVYITSDHGFLFEDKKFEEKDKHQVQEDNVDKKTRYYLTESDSTVQGITKFKVENVSGMTASGVYIAVPNGTNRLYGQGGYNFAHGGGSLQEIITPVIHSKLVRRERRGKVSVSLTGNNDLTLVSSAIKFALLQNDPVDANLRALDISYGVYINGQPLGKLEEMTLDMKSEDWKDRVKELTIRLTTIPSSKDVIELRVYDKEDPLNPIINRNVRNSMSGIYDEMDF